MYVKNFYPSQVLQKRKEFVLLRKVFPIFLKKSSLVDFTKYIFIRKNMLVSYSTYKKYKMEDIVQGLPKVEQLLEARKKTLNSTYENVHEKLNFIFMNFQADNTKDVAVRKSFFQIQEYLLNATQAIYQSQGVNISDKHLEIIIKQMTSKVMITSSGDSSLMVGDVFDLNLIENLNATLCKKIVYEPILVGITRLSLACNSFLAAASFQETTRVLVKSALGGKIDWLCGLKENLVLGNIIPAGTGYIKDNQS